MLFFSIQYGEQKHRETFAVENHQQAVDHLLSALLDHEIIKSLDEIAGVGHRVAHGGEAFSDSACIDAAALQQIEHLGTLAPLHNPVNAIGIRAFMEALPHAKAVAVFDTSFHQTMPPETFLYALPYRYYQEQGIRRYGFHGTSHKYVSQICAEKNGNTSFRPAPDQLPSGKWFQSVCHSTWSFGEYIYGFYATGWRYDGNTVRRY